ncbi:MAG: hypothetical protein JWL83_4043 [Actinomycetia bacterium]|nr:hypothetical protein [Actinomycetes bacterium]
MSVDGIASIQARIAQIQQQFTPAKSTSSSSSSASGGAGFADLLAAASSIGTDGTTTGANGTSTNSLTTALANALGGNAAGGSQNPLSALLQSLSSGTATGNTGTTGTTGMTGVAGGSTANQAFLQNALAQNGDAYVYGASTSPTDTNPTAFDCSELVKWAAGRAGVTVPDVAQNQYLWLKNQGKLMPVEQAIKTPGALLFSFSSEPAPGNMYPAHAHVAISLGNGKTIEARGSAYGVGIFDATTSRFNYAGAIPGLTA